MCYTVSQNGLLGQWIKHEPRHGGFEASWYKDSGTTFEKILSTPYFGEIAIFQFQCSQKTIKSPQKQGMKF